MSEKLSYRDRMLPVQAEQSHLFEGDATELLDQMYATMTATCDLASPHSELSLELTPLHRIEEMASAPLNLRFLQLLVKMTGARRVLEIGSFIGVSAIYMAKALPEDGRLVTIEKFDHFAGICRQNFAANGVSDRIDIIEGDAFEVLDGLTNEAPFDLAVIDGDKGRYDSYFPMVDKLVRAGGLVYVDDVFFHGDALNQTPTTEKGQGVKRFLELLGGREDYFCSVLPIANGVALAIKRNT